MPKPKPKLSKKYKTHQRSREVVCVGCHTPSPKHRKITKNLEKLVQEQIYSGFSLDNDAFLNSSVG